MTLQELLRRASEFDESKARWQTQQTVNNNASMHFDCASMTIGKRQEHDRLAPLFKELEKCVEALDKLNPTCVNWTFYDPNYKECGCRPCLAQKALKSLRERLEGMV